MDQDGIETLMPTRRGQSEIVPAALRRHTPQLAIAGCYVAATLDATFRDQDVVIEGVITVLVTVRDRITLQLIGGGEHEVDIEFAPAHRPTADTQPAEPRPGQE